MTPAIRFRPVAVAPVALLLGLLLLSGCGKDDKGDGQSAAERTKATQTLAQRRAAALKREREAEAAEQGTLAPAANVAGVANVRQGLPRFFSPQSPWNVQVTGFPAEPQSDVLLNRARIRTGVVEVPGRGVRREPRIVTEGIFVNTERWTTPIVTDEGGEVTRVFCRQARCGTDASDLRRLKIPQQASPDPRYDGWFTVIDRAKNTAWDFWRARRQRDGSMSFQFVRKWDLNGPGYLAPGTVSARGSGLPLFAGVITAEELEQGQINHALAISLPGAAASFLVAPASSTDGNGATNSLPEGARIRLRPTVRLRLPSSRGLKRRRADAIILALQRYGAIVVDRAAVPTLYAQKDVSAKLFDGFELSDIKLTDFEVLTLGQRYRYPPLATTRQVGIGGADGTGATGPTKSRRPESPARAGTGATGVTGP